MDFLWYCWLYSAEEAGRYLEAYKIYENKSVEALMEKTDTDYLSKVILQHIGEELVYTYKVNMQMVWWRVWMFHNQNLKLKLIVCAFQYVDYKHCTFQTEAHLIGIFLNRFDKSLYEMTTDVRSSFCSMLSPFHTHFMENLVFILYTLP